jgi:hypothetical protein
MEFPEELTTKHKEIISDIITKFNHIEKSVKEIIANYIDSDKNEFINEILLSSLILNFTTKNKILKYIVATEEIKVSSDFKKGMLLLMTSRNIIAHSDNLLEYDIIRFEENFNPSRSVQSLTSLGGTAAYQKVVPKKQMTLNDDKIQNMEIEKIHENFIKYFAILLQDLKQINIHIEKLTKNKDR